MIIEYGKSLKTGERMPVSINLNMDYAAAKKLFDTKKLSNILELNFIVSENELAEPNSVESAFFEPCGIISICEDDFFLVAAGQDYLGFAVFRLELNGMLTRLKRESFQINKAICNKIGFSLPFTKGHYFVDLMMSYLHKLDDSDESITLLEYLGDEHLMERLEIEVLQDY